MEKLNRDTKKAQALIEAFKRSTKGQWLGDVYGTYSAEKYTAWLYCLRLQESLRGSGLTVTSHNCWYFSAAFIYADPDTGEATLAYITASHDYAIKL